MQPTPPAAPRTGVSRVVAAVPPTAARTSADDGSNEGSAAAATAGGFVTDDVEDLVPTSNSLVGALIEPEPEPEPLLFDVERASALLPDTASTRPPSPTTRPPARSARRGSFERPPPAYAAGSAVAERVAALGEALRAELSVLKMGQLRKRAVDEGLEEAAIDAILDGTEPLHDLVAAVVAHVTYRNVQKRGKLSKEGSGCDGRRRRRAHPLSLSAVGMWKTLRLTAVRRVCGPLRFRVDVARWCVGRACFDQRARRSGGSSSWTMSFSATTRTPSPPSKLSTDTARRTAHLIITLRTLARLVLCPIQLLSVPVVMAAVLLVVDAPAGTCHRRRLC